MKPFTLLPFLLFPLLLTSCSNSNPGFTSALPVWAEGRETKKNLTLIFESGFETPEHADNCFLRITGSSLYRIYLNDEFVGHGPARAGHGYYRVDEWELTDHLTDRTNHLRIEVASYNVNSYYLLDQPGFVQAEVVSGRKTLKATGRKDDFMAYEMTERVQKVPRYSFQRPFIEYYQLRPRTQDPGPKSDRRLKTRVTRDKKLITRGIPYPDFEIVRPGSVVAAGTVKTGIKREQYWKDRAVTNIGPKLGGFPEEELEYNPSVELQEMENSRFDLRSSNFEPLTLAEKEFIILDLGTNLTGFIGLEVEVHEETRLFACFDEILQNNDVNWRRLGTMAAVTYDFCKPEKSADTESDDSLFGRGTEGDGTGRIFKLESFEPYTFRYLKLIVPKGSVTIHDVYLREYANPDIGRATFSCSDERLNRIFAAGVETFRQNAVDIFMDCPQRERAGWLCDSYFTARVANDLSGNTLVEHNFFENFLLPDSIPHLPQGMLPMCYPADHPDSVFIPNWAMWFVVQLEEYLHRSGDQKMVNELKPRVMALLDYFEPFKNESGLLEKLDSWIFIEWSAANQFVQDVNYPTNMLFAKTLEVAGRLYGQAGLMEEAAAIRDTIREQAFNGQFFVDHAIREADGSLQIQGDITEVCQYFAFYFGVAHPETHPELWKVLTRHFGPGRQENNLYPAVHMANSFVGNYIRIELLARQGLQRQLLDESIHFFDYMALETGTLWENTGTYASCNHGFASHVVHVFYRDILGITHIDKKESVVGFQLSDIPLEACEGAIPVDDDLVSLKWQKKGGKLYYSYTIPEGYRAVITNNTSLEAQKI